MQDCILAEEAAAMETDEKDEKEGAEASKDGEEAGKPKAPEALSYKLDNPSRVTPAQQKFVAHDEASRWRPIHPGRQVTGIIVFKDLQPGAHGFLKGERSMQEHLSLKCTTVLHCAAFWDCQSSTWLLKHL
jgi:hypothetical protein